MERQSLKRGRRWVVKIGSSLLTNNGKGLDQALIQSLTAELAALCDRGVEVVLVSSGAVAEGVKRLGWDGRPDAVYQLQAAAAVGQMGLVEAYESNFQKYGRHAAQILLTHDDIRDRRRYLNARSTLWALLELGVIPVVNENDTVSVDEIRFGDNDTLAALVANLVEADVLVILTDQKGMFDKDPNSNPDARFIDCERVDTPGLLEMASSGKPGKLGRGGMRTKVEAALLAGRSGAATVIASGREADILTRLHQGEVLGTYLYPDGEPIVARKRWLAGHLQVRGRLVLDDGAASVIRKAGKSLLAVGVAAVEGVFSRGELVSCVTLTGEEVARGLINYDAVEVALIKGRSSQEIEGILGYVDEPELIHRDNLVLI